MAHTTTLRSVGLLIALAFALAAGSIATALPAAAASEPPVVILYGDSLAWESQDHFVAAVTLGTDATAIGRSFGGTAICDYFDIMREDAASLHPAAVVLEFSGNRFTTCMHHPDGSGMGDGDAYMKYVADVREAVRIFTSVGTHVYLAGAPVSRPVPGSFQRGRALNVMYSWVALVERSWDGDLRRRRHGGAAGDRVHGRAAVSARGAVPECGRFDCRAVVRRCASLPGRRLASRPAPRRGASCGRAVLTATAGRWPRR